MAVFNITNILSCKAATITVEGAVEATIKIDKVQRPSRADAEVNDTFIDTPFITVSGTLLVDDEDAYLLCDGATKVLVLTWKNHLGTTMTTTLGVVTAPGSGVIFTGYSLTAPNNAADGPVFRWALTFEGVFAASDTTISTYMVTTGP